MDISRVCFTPRAPTPLLFDGGGETLACRTRSSVFPDAPEQLGADWAADAEMLAFSSACLVSSPCRYTHLAALDAARTAGVLVCFVPLRPALRSSCKTLRDTVMQSPPSRTSPSPSPPTRWSFCWTPESNKVGLFAPLRGGEGPTLRCLETEGGVHAFTRAAHAFVRAFRPARRAGRTAAQLSRS